jgi:hypothetical protein
MHLMRLPKSTVWILMLSFIGCLSACNTSNQVRPEGSVERRTSQVRGTYEDETPRAHDRFDKTIVLNQGTGQIVADDLSYGDTVNLTLKNPTSSPLIFETKYPILGSSRTWVVPANDQRTVSFEYKQPFQDDLTYTVRQQRTGVIITYGILIPVDQNQVGTEDNQFEEVTQSSTAQTERRSTVRGFW